MRWYNCSVKSESFFKECEFFLLNIQKNYFMSILRNYDSKIYLLIKQYYIIYKDFKIWIIAKKDGNWAGLQKLNVS